MLHELSIGGSRKNPARLMAILSVVIAAGVIPWRLTNAQTASFKPHSQIKKASTMANDPEARKLFDEMHAKFLSLTSLTADWKSVYQTKRVDSKLEVRNQAGSLDLQRPNFARYTNTTQQTPFILDSDGKFLWLAGEGRYIKLIADPKGLNIYAGFSDIMGMFFSSGVTQYKSYKQAKIRRLPAELVDGKITETLEIKGQHAWKYTLILNLNEDRLPVRFRETLEDPIKPTASGSKEYSMSDTTYSNCKLNEPSPKNVYQYKPSADLKLFVFPNGMNMLPLEAPSSALPMTLKKSPQRTQRPQ